MPYPVRLPTIVVAVFLFSLLGCGEKTIVGTSISKQDESQRCISCHGVASKVTNKPIVDEWRLSGHNTKNGASCGDCHEPHQSHPDAGNCNRCHGGSPVVGSDVTINADAAGKCAKCHTKNGGFKSAQINHFNNITSTLYPASYVSSMYEKNCRKCHNPHDTVSAMNYMKDWATSSHGVISNNPDYIKAKTRNEVDFKTAGTSLPASKAVIDTSSGNYQMCLRCHTTTGYINYVKSGFSDLNPFAGPGFPVKTYSTEMIKPGFNGSKVSPDKTKELTSCDACHDDGNGNSYSYRLRNVSQVITYYNFTSLKGVKMSGGKISNFSLKYPDVYASNICVACHSGRLTGLDVKMADVRNLDFGASKRIVNHFRGAAQMLLKAQDINGNEVGAGFEFYSSGTNKLQGYKDVSFTHNIIGTPKTNPLQSPEGTLGMASDPRGYGPCIGCHLNLKNSLKNSQTSHTFSTVNRSITINPADPITGSVSNSCATCHADSINGDEWSNNNYKDVTTGNVINRLEFEKREYQATVKAFSRLLKFAVDTSKTRTWEDGEGRPATPANWYGSNTTGQRIQPWLRTSTLPDNSDKPVAGLDYYVLGAQFVDPITGVASPLRNAAYTMGAVYNFFMMYYDPGAFAHNRNYAKRLIFDSMDWLDDGKLNKSVCDPNEKLFTLSAPNTPTTTSYRRLNKYGTGIVGQYDTFTFDAYLTSEEITKASYYLCRKAVSSPDHRPPP